jgi:hypothetical protein
MISGFEKMESSGRVASTGAHEEDDEVGEVASMTTVHEVIAICTGTDLYFVVDMGKGKSRSYWRA